MLRAIRPAAISEDIPKSFFTFENTTVGGWGSSYLFFDFLRSWSEVDTNAVTLEMARALGIPIDMERTSGVGANVMRLRQLMESQ